MKINFLTHQQISKQAQKKLEKSSKKKKIFKKNRTKMFEKFLSKIQFHKEMLSVITYHSSNWF